MASRGRRNRFGAGALAGWLFADLALILAFVFLDSTSSGQGAGQGTSDSTEISTTTSTTLPALGSGARPEPYKVTIRASADTSAPTIITRLEGELSRLDDVRQGANEIYLVIIANGGSRGVDRRLGSDLARIVAQKIEDRWDRVIKGRTYFVVGDTTQLPRGQVSLQLFPAQVDAVD